jgi:hypothetical protein
MNGKVGAFERSQFVTLPRASWTANLRLAQGLVMSDTQYGAKPLPSLTATQPHMNVVRD